MFSIAVLQSISQYSLTNHHTYYNGPPVSYHGTLSLCGSRDVRMHSLFLNAKHFLLRNIEFLITNVAYCFSPNISHVWRLSADEHLWCLRPVKASLRGLPCLEGPCSSLTEVNGCQYGVLPVISERPMTSSHLPLKEQLLSFCLRESDPGDASPQQRHCVDVRLSSSPQRCHWYRPCIGRSRPKSKFQDRELSSCILSKVRLVARSSPSSKSRRHARLPCGDPIVFRSPASSSSGNK